jgi:hypothetical protein
MNYEPIVRMDSVMKSLSNKSTRTDSLNPIKHLQKKIILILLKLFLKTEVERICPNSF